IRTELEKHSALRTDVDALSNNLTGLSEQLTSSQNTVHNMLRYRDERMDNDARSLQQLIRDVDALHEVPRVAHEPIPADAEVAVCDAGILLMPADEVFFPWIKYHRCWETEEAALITKLMRQRSGIFLDIGAHVG